MEWTVFLAVAAACLLLSVVLAVARAKAKYKSGRLLDPSKILFIGVIVSSVILFIPIYINTFKTSDCGIFETVLIAIHNMIRLFIVDGEFAFITSNLEGVPKEIYHCYTALFSILFVLAPILTFGFVLSFFKNVSAYKRYLSHYTSRAFIFSELNEKSLALAVSLHQSEERDRLFVFTDVFEQDEEKNYEMVEKAKEIGAICFKKDIVTINFAHHSKKSELNFFVIGEDYSENINQSLKIVERYKERENTRLYIFSTQAESEFLVSNVFNNFGEEEVKIKVRRVNEVQALITRNLYEKGFEEIFCSALPEDGVKKIRALIIGMGRHGAEMTKALSWFCQMDGYQVEIDAFDVDDKAEDRFISLCPELMDPRFNGDFERKGDARYKITIHSGMDVGTKSFEDFVGSMEQITYAFVALGNDEMNISGAVKLRTIFKRMGYHPKIQSIVYNSDKKEALKDIRNFKGHPYDIDFIGDMKSSYSEKAILTSEVEEAALSRHLKWGEENDFWRYDYNYRSSVASAIHSKMKVLCGMKGSEKKKEDRSEEERWALRELEHRRWNAYMRSEGYIYGGTIEQSGRDDLAKKHNCLVPFDQLPLKEQEKDDD